LIKILLIEDDIVDQLAIKRLIQKATKIHDIDTAISVMEANTKLLEKNFDLVITDYNLNDGTAVELSNLLKDTPFIILSGNETHFLDHSFTSNAIKHLTKDFDMEYLEEVSRIISAIEKEEIPSLTNFDIQILNNQFDEDKTQIKEIIDLFLQKHPKDLAALEEASTRAEWEVLNDIAHRVKSNYRLFGFKELSLVAEEIEQQSSQKNISTTKIKIEIQKLHQASENIFTLLRHEQKKMDD